LRLRHGVLDLDLNLNLSEALDNVADVLLNIAGGLDETSI
jgi:hypothetical protein